MRVETFLQESAGLFPDKEAIVAGQKRVTYASLDALADRIAAGLQQRGVTRGDRVVIFLDNCVETVAAVFGALKAGAVYSVINPTTKAGKLAFILNNCQARALVTHARLLDPASEAVDQAPSVACAVVVDGPDEPAIRGGVSLDELLATAPAEVRPHGGIDADLAGISYTSGSTGEPKGVMMTHQNIRTVATSIASYLANGPEDVILNVLPLSFGYGLYQVLVSCLVGSTVVLEKSIVFPYAFLQTLQKERITGFPLVPTIGALLLQVKDLPPGGFPHLRYMTNAAAALPTAHAGRLLEMFRGASLYQMYGMTECTRATYLPPDQLSVRPGSVGKAIPNTDAYVVNEYGERARPGEVGELVIRGGHVMQGYWGDPEGTARILRPGARPWERELHSGDLFKTDEEGYLYFVSRKDDIIKTGGQKVSPNAVEAVLYTLEGVREAAVVGVPDPILGQAIKAVIVPTETSTLTERQILRHCARHLEDYMTPKVVEFRQELPKTTTGKIRRKEIRV
jgi:long-chain acyl-CoA synthetase